VNLQALLGSSSEVFIRQRKEWVEILVDWETKNQYASLDADGNELGSIVEKAGGFFDHLRRGFLRSHRSLEVGVFDRTRARVLLLTRPFFFFFSRLSILGPQGEPVGCVERRFGVLYKRYDLLDSLGHRFAQIAGPRWRLWTFPIDGANGITATISKKWSGVFREVFSDADTFRIEFGAGGWSEEQRAVILAAAIAIDFDFFENNQGNQGLLNN
jgi:uncharacterized protein YxjI